MWCSLYFTSNNLLKYLSTKPLHWTSRSTPCIPIWALPGFANLIIQRVPRKFETLHREGTAQEAWRSSYFSLRSQNVPRDPALRGILEKENGDKKRHLILNSLWSWRKRRHSHCWDLHRVEAHLTVLFPLLHSVELLVGLSFCSLAVLIVTRVGECAVFFIRRRWWQPFEKVVDFQVSDGSSYYTCLRN